MKINLTLNGPREDIFRISVRRAWPARTGDGGSEDLAAAARFAVRVLFREQTREQVA